MKLAICLIANGTIFGLTTYFFGAWALLPVSAAYLVGVFQTLN